MPKISAKGIIVKYGTSANPTNVLANVKTIGFNQGAREMIDVTTHDSTTSKQYVDGGLRETAEIELSLVYDPADTGAEALRGYHAAGTLCYIVVVLPDTGAAQWEAAGHITQFNIPARGVNDALEANITFKAKSVDTFTA